MDQAFLRGMSSLTLVRCRSSDSTLHSRAASMHSKRLSEGGLEAVIAVHSNGMITRQCLWDKLVCHKDEYMRFRCRQDFLEGCWVYAAVCLSPAPPSNTLRVWIIDRWLASCVLKAAIVPSLLLRTPPPSCSMQRVCKKPWHKGTLLGQRHTRGRCIWTNSGEKERAKFNAH